MEGFFASLLCRSGGIGRRKKSYLKGIAQGIDDVSNLPRHSCLIAIPIIPSCQSLSIAFPSIFSLFLTLE